jgi:hypothetical protein
VITSKTERSKRKKTKCSIERERERERERESGGSSLLVYYAVKIALVDYILCRKLPGTIVKVKLVTCLTDRHTVTNKNRR